jgi:uncharacterized protein YbjT (DUF2867 family)
MGTNNPQETKTTLVLGGTGKTGRRVVERLSARGSGRGANQRLGIKNYRQLAPNDSDCSAKRNFDRDLTVTGVNNGEQGETRDPGIWRKKADF